MPSYIGLRRIGGSEPMTPEQLGQMHTNATRGRGATCIRSWIAEDTRTLYCLIEADSHDFAQRLHGHDRAVEHLETSHVRDIYLSMPSADT